MPSNDKSTRDTVLIEKAIEHAFGLSEKKKDSSIFSDQDLPVRYYFYPAWRSRLGHLVLFFFLSVAAIMLSYEFPQLVVQGDLFTVGNTVFVMHMPILMFIPGYVLARALMFIYNSRYIIDERGAEAQIGLVSLRLRQTRLKYEDIRGVRAIQSILDRILNIGTVEIGSAMTEDIEIRMLGVENPRAIQILVCKERDKRLKTIVSTTGSKAAAIDIDTRD